MDVTLQISAQIWHRTSAYVLQDNVERHAFIYCDSCRDSENVCLRAVDLKMPSEGDYKNASVMDVVLERDYVIQCLKKARRSKQSIVDVHSHPFEKEAHFSNVDYKYGSEAANWITRKISEGTFPYILWGMVVVGRQSAEGLVWNHESHSFQEFSEIVIQDGRKRRKAVEKVRGKSWMDLIRRNESPEQITGRTDRQPREGLVSMVNVRLSRISPCFHPGTIRLYALRRLAVDPYGRVRLMERNKNAAERFFPFGLTDIDTKIRFRNLSLGCQNGFHANCHCQLSPVIKSVRKQCNVIDLTRFIGKGTTDATGIVDSARKYFEMIAAGTGGFQWDM